MPDKPIVHHTYTDQIYEGPLRPDVCLKGWMHYKTTECHITSSHIRKVKKEHMVK
jgi:hypothetical protein